jgi:cell wall-associated NlpC family hydrolase
VAEENNIGASRLIGTNGLQQAVDSLTTQVGKLAGDLGKLSTGFNNMTGATNRATGSSGSTMGNLWNAGSNRSSYASNGGGGRFTIGSLGGGSANGGGGNFGNLMGMSRMSATVGAVAGVASSLTSYANKNMSTNMQMDYFGTSAATAGGFSNGNYRGANQVARSLVFNNNYAALNATDAARSGYVNQYTFGAAQFNGQANPAFVSGMRQAGGFAYANPTQGAYGGALAAQQTYSARAAMVAPGLGLASPILAGGVKNSMGNIAQSIMQRTFGNNNITSKQMNAALSQGGSLDVNLQYFGQQMGWSNSTINEYRNVLQGQVAAQNNGMSSNKYYSLLGQASGGNKSAISQLAKTTGMGSSMFENQRNLNSARLTRQNDILNSLAPAFDSATQAVTKFSQALTATLHATGMDKLIGTGGGALAPISNALGGMSSGFGAGLGVLGAARLFSGSGGLSGLFTRGAASAGEGGLINATGARGVPTITSLGTGGGGVMASLGGAGGVLSAALLGGWGLSKLGSKDVTGHSTAGQSVWNWMKNSFSWTGIKNTLNPARNLPSIFGGSSSGSGGATGVTGNSSRNNSIQGASTASAAQIIKYAETQLGVPYVWGGEQPGKGMDCSGLTQWAYGKAGVKIPRVAADQQKIGTKVGTNKTQAGDLLFVGNPAHHVVMSIGGGRIIEAPHTGESVKIRALNPSEYTSATRIVGSIGNMNSLLNNNSDNSSGTLNNQQSTLGGDIGDLSGTSELAAIQSALATSAGGLSLAAGAQTASSTSASGSPAASNPKATGKNDKASLQSYAKALLAKYGWSDQWQSFNALEMSEAGWNYKATNPTSGAYGLAQALPASKYGSAGSDWRTSGDTQLNWMMQYIKGRYGSPDSAWSFHQKNNWYDVGAWSIDKDQSATVHKGEMIIPAQQAETIRQTLLNNTFNPNLQKAAGTGSNAGITFGDINVHLPGSYSGTAQEARSAGKMVVDAIEGQLRIKNLQIGQ